MLATYSPQDIVVTLAGIHSLQGFIDGEFVRISKDIKPFTKVRAMDGELARIYNDDDGYKVELTLMQTSPSNNVLDMLYNVDVATRMGKFPLMIRDTRGTTSFLALTAWIEERPDVVFSNSMTPRTWVFGCADVAAAIGGNVPQSAVEQALLIGAGTLPLLRQFGAF